MSSRRCVLPTLLIASSLALGAAPAGAAPNGSLATDIQTTTNAGCTAEAGSGGPICELPDVESTDLGAGQSQAICETTFDGLSALGYGQASALAFSDATSAKVLLNANALAHVGIGGESENGAVEGDFVDLINGPGILAGCARGAGTATAFFFVSEPVLVCSRVSGIDGCSDDANPASVTIEVNVDDSVNDKLAIASADAGAGSGDGHGCGGCEGGNGACLIATDSVFFSVSVSAEAMAFFGETDQQQGFAGLVACVTRLSDELELSLCPADGTNRVGTPHTVIATVRAKGCPVPGVAVEFEVGGANSGRSGADVTDEHGRASFTYVGAVAGNDTIRACATSVNGSRFDGPCGSANKYWQSARRFFRR